MSIRRGDVAHDTKKRRKFKFNDEEDNNLRELVSQYGTDNWNIIASMLNGRTPRQCRDRWNHYLSQEENKKPWTEAEDFKLINYYQDIGSKWATIATYFPDRTAVDIRNRCCRLLRKRNSPKEITKPHVTVPVTKKTKTTLPSCQSLPFPVNIRPGFFETFAIPQFVQ